MFKPNHNSHYKMHANKTLDWLPMDTKQLYEKNLKENYQLLKSNNWIDKSFTYKFNSYGFRCEEFTTEPTIMFLGCSLTCGLGLPIETIWPELVAIQLNMRCANLGQGGGSNDTAFRLCHGWIDIIKPQIVVLLNPPGFRFEMVEQDKLEHVNPIWTIRQHPAYMPFLKDWCRDENNNYFNTLKNNLAIENLCKTRNIKFIVYNNEEDTPFKKLDLARDLSHYGIKSNQLFADHLLNNL